ncbi:MAG: hypothetical protein ACTSQP_23365 [Promethearchaeota archaeon]
MKDIPDIKYDIIQPDYLDFNKIKQLLSSDVANLKNLRDLYVSRGIIDFSATKKNFSQNISTINLGPFFASEVINLIYSKGKFELGILTITIDKTLKIEDFRDIINERDQIKLDINRNPVVYPAHLEKNKFLHIKMVYDYLFWKGGGPITLKLTSYAIAELKNSDKKKTTFEISIIITHDTDYSVMKDSLARILSEEFGNKYSIKEFNINVDLQQVNILRRTFKELDKEFEIKGIVRSKTGRSGERDPNKPIIYRSGKLDANEFDFEEPDDLINEAEKENWTFDKIFFAFLDNRIANVIIVCSYNFKRFRTTVKFELAKFFEGDIDYVLTNKDTGEKSYNKLLELNDEDLEYGVMFLLLNKLIKILKNVYYYRKEK